MMRSILIGTMAVLLAPAGCGYKSEGLYRSEAQTVYVEMFASKEFRRDLEFQLTEAVKKRIGLDTPYRVAARENADTILTGEVLEETQAAFAPDPLSRQPREKTLSLVVRVQWKDQRSGRVLVEDPILMEAADYLPPTGETEHFAQERAIDRLARKIVARMYAEW